MASYDFELRRLVVDIAVDGLHALDCAASLQHMCRFFKTRWQHGARLRVGGRHREHEWLQVEGGVFEGIPVRCRVHALPRDDAELRRRLLARADVVIVACRTTPDERPRAQAHFELLWRQAQAKSGPPILLQVHGSDLPGSLSPHEAIASVSGRRAVGATGVDAALTCGIRETLVEAIGHAIRQAPTSVRAAAERDFHLPDDLDDP